MSVQTAATKNVSDKSSRGMSAHSSQLKHESIHAPEPKQQQKQTAAVIPEMKGDVPKEGAKEPKETAKESEETADSVDEKLLLPSDMKNQKEELIDGEKSIFGKKMDTTRMYKTLQQFKFRIMQQEHVQLITSVVVFVLPLLLGTLMYYHFQTVETALGQAKSVVLGKLNLADR